MATTQTTTQTNPLLARQPPSTTTNPSQPSQFRTRPYKDFLTPALHRRFVRAALVSLAGCYITSLLISWPSLWHLFTITLIRGLILFIPCLCVFIVRVRNMRFGSLNTASPAASVMEMAVGSRTGVVTLGWYIFSAWMFGEVYIWSQSPAWSLGMVDPGTKWERARVNENPVFLRAVFFVLALAQTGVHLGRGEDVLRILERDEDPTQTQQQQQSSSRIPTQLSARALPILLRTIRLAIPTFAFTIPTYFLLLRPLFWRMGYTIASTFYRPGPNHPALPWGHTGLTRLPTLSLHCFYASILLIALWEVSSAAFTITVARPPLTKTGQPLTSDERSRDPNGSLLSGLKSKRGVVKGFAWWELSLICAYFDVRRKSIYTEVDRQGGSTWAQISKLCIDEISSIQDRIQMAQQQSSPLPPQQQAPQQQQQQEQPYLGLPRIADRGLQNGDIWTKPMKTDFSHTVGTVAKSLGQNPGSPNPLVPRAKRAIEWGAERVFPKTSNEQQQGLSAKGLSQAAQGWIVRFLRTPVGEPFRRTFARKIKAVVLGSGPSGGNAINIIHASRALSTLCSRSLREDDYGQVAPNIALIIRTYVGAIKAIQGFVGSAQPDWTDVYFWEGREGQGRRVEEVEVVLNILREGLEGVVLGFGEYASAVGVSEGEMREARGLVGKGGKGEEMRKKV